MMIILKLFKIDISTYIYLLLSFLAGYIKESFIIYTIIIIHELGHLFTSYIFGYKIVKIKIYPFGGITISNKQINCPLNDDILIYFSGIIAQFISLFIFLLIKDYIGFSLYVEQLFLKYNLTIIIFNLLPIYPLDGFYIMKTINEKYISFKIAQFVSGLLSIITLILFSIVSIYYNNYLIIVILLLKQYEYFKTKNRVYHRFLLERHLNPIKYNKIIYIKGLKLEKIRRNCYHYFSNNCNLFSEQYLLSKKFDIKPSF